LIDNKKRPLAKERPFVFSFALFLTDLPKFGYLTQKLRTGGNAYMFMSRQTIVRHLNAFLDEKDRKQIDIFADLSWMATIVCEFGFQCRKEKREIAKDMLFGLWDPGTVKVEIRIEPGENKENYSAAENRELSIEDINIIRSLVYKLVRVERKITEEKMNEWLSEAWETGIRQNEIYNMETEGGVMNEYGIVTNFGAKLGLFGIARGFLPR